MSPAVKAVPVKVPVKVLVGGCDSESAVLCFQL